MMSWAWLAAPAAIPLAMTALNVITWTRGRARARWSGRVSVLVPARNEEANIEAAVRAIADSEHPVAEIIVCDDQSTDRTAAILDRLSAEIPELRVIRGAGPPAGWIGKPHACHQLSRVATGDLLIFVDADTCLSPTGIGRVVSCLLEQDAQVVTAVPRQRTETWAERLLMPLLMLTYTSWFPLALVARSSDPRFVAANGQLLAVRRDAYDRIGGMAAVAHEIVDDVAFCRRAKTRGEKVVFADGARMATCRMYGSFGELWRGFSKNIYEGIGATPWALAFVILLHVAVFVVPYAALAAGLFTGASWTLMAAAGVLLNVATRSLLAVRYGHAGWSVVLHPIAVLILCALAVNSARWSRLGRLRWAGRTYAARRARMGAAS